MGVAFAVCEELARLSAIALEIDSQCNMFSYSKELYVPSYFLIFLIHGYLIIWRQKLMLEVLLKLKNWFTFVSSAYRGTMTRCDVCDKGGTISRFRQAGLISEKYKRRVNQRRVGPMGLLLKFLYHRLHLHARLLA